jgi:hypothetical protein
VAARRPEPQSRCLTERGEAMPTTIQAVIALKCVFCSVAPQHRGSAKTPRHSPALGQL